MRGNRHLCHPDPRKTGVLGTLTRRDLLRGALTLGPALYLSQNAILRRVLAAPVGVNKNVIFVELFGGNDGYNTIVPYGIQGGIYYSEYRPNLGVAEADIVKITNNTEIGFNRAWTLLKNYFDAGKLAVVQGVSYPNPSFSHDTSQKIWAMGDPDLTTQKSWLAKYVDNQPTTSTPLAADLGDHLTSTYTGNTSFVPAIDSIDSVEFPFDEVYPGDKNNRRLAFETNLEWSQHAGGTAGAMAQTGLGLLGLIDSLSTVPSVPTVGAYPSSNLTNALKLALDLLKANLGIRVLHLGTGGFDTHAKQNEGDLHTNLLTNVSEALAAFQTDLEAQGLDQETIIVVYSEFGRTIYENGSIGSDHGSVNPVFILGTPVLGGLVNAHPSMDPANLTEDGEPPMVADFRDVFGTVGVKWLGQPAGSLFHNYTVNPMSFLA